MPGLFVALSHDAKLDLSKLSLNHHTVAQLVIDRKSLPGAVVERYTNPKFLDDKVFDEDDSLCVAMDGVILNFTQLRARYKCQTFFETVKAMYQDLGDKFFTEFRGEFAGALYDKAKSKWVFFADPTGAKRLFYYQSTDLFICGTDLPEITSTLRQLGRKTTLDVTGAYFLLSYGFMLEDYTLVTQVRRLKPGCSITFGKGGVFALDVCQSVGNEPWVTDSKGEIIERLDQLFCQAIRRAYDKDREYGYEHLATLSGGLDSRMNVMVAHALGYEDQTTVTFSQSNYFDQTIANQIASDLKLEFLFYSLDSGQYLLRAFHDAVRANGGQVLFAGSAHMLSAMTRVGMGRTGMLHTGMLGGGVMGSFLAAPAHTLPNYRGGAYCPHLLDRISSEAKTLAQRYESEELFLLYNRGFNGNNNGLWTAHQFTQCTSPFMDLDFLSYVMRVPRIYRYHKRIYREWMLKKYPLAGQYAWESTRAKPSSPRVVHWISRRLWMASILLQRKWHSASMNPFLHWERTNPALVAFAENYWKQQSHLLDDYPQLRADCESLFNTRLMTRQTILGGTLVNKTQVMTLLEAMGLLLGQ